MKTLLLFINVLSLIMVLPASAQKEFETDIIKTSAGDLRITVIGHGTLIFNFGGRAIHVDPYSTLADYNILPKADLILLTHQRSDHLDLKALNMVRTEKTVVVLTETCAKEMQGGIVMMNGDVKTVEGFKIKAVPPTISSIKGRPVSLSTQRG